MNYELGHAYLGQMVAKKHDARSVVWQAKAKKSIIH